MKRIAYCIRPDYLDSKGGDSIQLLKTKQYVEDLSEDIDIVIITDHTKLDRSYALVHIFNYANIQIAERFFSKALSLNIKIVSSPIYWDYSFAFRPLSIRLGWIPSFINENKAKVSAIFYGFMGRIFNVPLLLSNRFKKSITSFVESSEKILPNSIEEANLLYAFISKEIDNSKISVVYNGVDLSNVQILDSDIFYNKYQIPKNFIVQIGRIQYIKNQLNFLSAMMTAPEIPIVFIGRVIEQDYFNKLNKMAKKRGNVFFIEEVPHSEIYSFLFYAKVHVLLSFRESPGLVSLEALSQNCNIVVPDSRFLPLDTYFSKNTVSVDLFDKDSIYKGVMTAYTSTPSSVNLERFSWTNVGKQTYECYKELI